MTRIDPCQEPVFLAEHGGSVEECQKQYEMILHQFELENEAERKARFRAVYTRLTNMCVHPL